MPIDFGTVNFNKSSGGSSSGSGSSSPAPAPRRPEEEEALMRMAMANLITPGTPGSNLQAAPQAAPAYAQPMNRPMMMPAATPSRAAFGSAPRTGGGKVQFSYVPGQNAGRPRIGPSGGTPSAILGGGGQAPGVIGGRSDPDRSLYQSLSEAQWGGGMGPDLIRGASSMYPQYSRFNPTDQKALEKDLDLRNTLEQLASQQRFSEWENRFQSEVAAEEARKGRGHDLHQMALENFMRYGVRMV
jgi:hypothetical protein